MKRIGWVTLGWLALLTTGQAASFDCGKARTHIEQMICGDDQLSKWDSSLAQYYKKVLDQSNDSDKAILKSEQEDWLVNVRDACLSKQCIEDAYRHRENIFKGVDSPARGDMNGNKFKAITHPNDVARLVSDTNKLLKILGFGKIDYCAILIETPIINSQGNASYGAICRIVNGKINYGAMLCKNEMIGTFTMKFTFGLSNNEVMKFTNTNCID